MRMVLKVCFLIQKVQRDLIGNEVTNLYFEVSTTLLPPFHALDGPTARHSYGSFGGQASLAPKRETESPLTQLD